MQSSTTNQPCSPRLLLRWDEAIEIIERSYRTLRYHAKKGDWLKPKGLYYAADVYALKRKLELYYREPFQPGSRSRGRKGKA